MLLYMSLYFTDGEGFINPTGMFWCQGNFEQSKQCINTAYMTLTQPLYQLVPCPSRPSSRCDEGTLMKHLGNTLMHFWLPNEYSHELLVVFCFYSTLPGCGSSWQAPWSMVIICGVKAGVYQAALTPRAVQDVRETQPPLGFPAYSSRTLHGSPSGVFTQTRHQSEAGVDTSRLLSACSLCLFFYFLS